jgi:hypothetical protein
MDETTVADPDGGLFELGQRLHAHLKVQVPGLTLEDITVESDEDADLEPSIFVTAVLADAEKLPAGEDLVELANAMHAYLRAAGLERRWYVRIQDRDAASDDPVSS